jgi:hypothetical protein
MTATIRTNITNFISQTTEFQFFNTISAFLGVYAVQAIKLYDINPLAASAGWVAFSFTGQASQYFLKRYPSKKLTAQEFENYKIRQEMATSIMRIFAIIIGFSVYSAVNGMSFNAALILNTTIILISLASKAALYYQSQKK